MKLELSNRMQIIADYIKNEDTVADIGTDHGYIPIWLLLNKRCSHVIFADVNQGPLDRAESNARMYLGNDFKADLRLGSGIEILNTGEVDAVIIAGMGGILIRDILSKEAEKTNCIKKLILQPRSNSDVLRKWLNTESEFTIVSERAVREGKKYSEIICAVHNSLISDDDEIHEEIKAADMLRKKLQIPYEFSLEIPCLYIVQKDPEAGNYLERRYSSENEIKNSIIKSGRNESSRQQLIQTESRLKYIISMIDAYKEAMNETK